jgi:hypothetical protein
MSITSSKLKIEIQIFFQKLASVDFGFWFSKIYGIEWKKVPFFKKKAKKKQISKFRTDRKKHFRKKVLLRSSYIHYENQCSKNQMVTSHTVDSY